LLKKIPRYVEIVDEFPMTPSGKIQKFRLREMLRKAIEDGTPVKLEPSVK
jgi:fatty-acyl-CoA synthase